MKAKFVGSALTTLAAIAITAAVHAEDFDGIYQPQGYDWTCDPDDIGMDGGALAIGGGYIDGVENRCELQNPRKSTSTSGTQFTAVCSGEGMEYREELTITSTENGVRILRDGHEIMWARCGEGQSPMNTDAASQGSDDRWGYANTRASIISGGNSFTLSCEPFNPSSTYPTALLSASCPACFPGETTKYTIRIDDVFKATYEFERVSNAAGSSSDLGYYPDWHDGLVPALMAGSKLQVLENDGVIASFPLSGSSRAIGQLRDDCN